MSRKKLTLELLKNKLNHERENGGFVYVKKNDDDGKPLNFKIDGSNAITGKWRHPLLEIADRPNTWILVFDGSRAWLGDYKYYERVGDKYNYYLSNLTEPFNVSENKLHEITGKQLLMQPYCFMTSNERKKSQRVKFVDSHIDDEIQLIVNQQNASKTEIQQEILARLGQGKFREAVLKRWENACAVTGCTTKAALRASHIRPWRDSNAKERLSPNNGLPLIATLDALFDKGLISFDENGKILVSKSLSKKEQKLLGVTSELRLNQKIGLNDEQKKFLIYHNRKVFLTK